MAQAKVQLTEDEFYDKYPLVTNHLGRNDGFDGCLFETYGAELAFVAQQDPSTIWTVVNSIEGDSRLILSGLHTMNRIGYLVSKIPVQEGLEIEISLDD
jgi:hypothetical protein